ncbi:hypothetical protein [Chitiniphilus eburneus]
MKKRFTEEQIIGVLKEAEEGREAYMLNLACQHLPLGRQIRVGLIL